MAKYRKHETYRINIVLSGRNMINGHVSAHCSSAGLTTVLCTFPITFTLILQSQRVPDIILYPTYGQKNVRVKIEHNTLLLRMVINKISRYKTNMMFLELSCERERNLESMHLIRSIYQVFSQYTNALK